MSNRRRKPELDEYLTFRMSRGVFRLVVGLAVVLLAFRLGVPPADVAQLLR